MLKIDMSGGWGDLTQGSVHFPAEQGTDPGAAIFKIPGMYK